MVTDIHCDDNPVHLDHNSEFLHTPPEIFDLYLQADNICFDSPRGSAVLCRCCLEQFLARIGYRGSLKKKIRQMQRETNVNRSFSSYIRDAMEFVRIVGNVAAHPRYDSKSCTTAEIEQEMAELCLEIIRDVFKEYYEKPLRFEQARMTYERELSSFL
ncbi:DUF4145 domain-containing protein [Rhizobium sp. 1399]|uniref:DUF4145 domain-containing protein n=1 Tax=Rhizobium sp. 1399 TaxID=2817758 RepID=UPI002865B1F6|nr:DUF4145 domain-containing protein [Rhizobium sp. 1399]MDR6667062.1 hypothetical protein [Rhizobium sp. 1399]